MMSRFRHSENGATAVEFALVAVPLGLVLFAIIEVSLMLAAQHQLQGVTDAMARMIRSGKVTAKVQEPQFREESSGEAYQSSYQPGGPERPGSLIVTYDWEFFGPLDMFGNLPDLPRTRRISGLAIYKNDAF